MQQAHHNRRAANGEASGEANGDQAQAGTKANRHHSKVELVARAGVEGADEAIEQWAIRVVSNFYRCVAINASKEAQLMNLEYAQLDALHQMVEAVKDEETRIRNKLKPPHLSERTRDVLRLVQQGLSSAKIADQLCISRCSVDTYISRVCAKLHVSGRKDALRAALRQGLL